MFQLHRGNGSFPFHVTDSQGLPHIPLTIYACRAEKYLSPATAKAYIRCLMAFFCWAEQDEIVRRQEWDLLGNSAQVRATLEYFLTDQLNCTLFWGRDLSGTDIRKIQVTWGKSYRVTHLLAALRSFYQLLIAIKFYSPPHPLDLSGVQHILAGIRKQHLDCFVKRNQRPPMPFDSGIDRWRPLRLNSSYYRLKDSQWIPMYLDDPMLMNSVLKAGEDGGWALRDIALVRILFDSGCRIHEACSLTLQDWQSSGFRNLFSSLSKGSRGKRVKNIIVTDKTLKVLLRYIRQERPELLLYINGHRSIPALDEDELPLFVTKRGLRITPDYFRRYRWTPILKAAGLKLCVHQIRHWFVTMALNEIQSGVGSETEIRQKRSTLKTLMGWKSDMLPAYDQARQRHDLPHLASTIHAYIEKKQYETPRISEEEVQRESGAELMLREMFGDSK